MDLADRVGAKVLFFYDVFTEYSCPGINGRVADEILSRGHFLELHTHIEHLPEWWWQDRGYKRPGWASNYFDPVTVDLVYSDAIRLFEKCAGVRPTAYRAGSWRFSANILSFLARNGVRYSFNYHPLTTIRQNFPHGPDAGPLDLFIWSNGMLEIPVATLTVPNPFTSKQKYFGFESHMLREPARYFDFMRVFARQMPTARHAVLVMHSWSLAEFAGNVATAPCAERTNAFAQFLELGAKEGVHFAGENLFQSLDATQPQFTVPIEFAGFANSPLVKL
ncbi:MAG: hypothetical protein WCK51_15935 [Armatimonadota bacterium]